MAYNYKLSLSTREVGSCRKETFEYMLYCTWVYDSNPSKALRLYQKTPSFETRALEYLAS